MMDRVISISPGNSKMGLIPSVSLPPVVTCAAGVPCAAKCYAAKLCRIYPTVKNAYARNLEIFQNSPDHYFLQLNAAIAVSRFFRLHVSGDFPTLEYVREVLRIARNNAHCQIMAFAKRYTWVNALIDAGEEIPENLHIIFSGWGGYAVPNPHNLPMSQVIFKGESPAENWKVCGGNCAECATTCGGCWALKRGETVAFYEH